SLRTGQRFHARPRRSTWQPRRTTRAPNIVRPALGLRVHLSFTRISAISQKGGDYFIASRLVCAGPIPLRELPALPATRHFQVRRDWCPETVFTDSLSVNPDSYGPRVVGNTYQKG